MGIDISTHSRTKTLSLFHCHFLFETLSTYIPVVRVLRMASFSVSGISMPGTGCECQNPYIARLQEDVDRLWKEKIFLQVIFWWTGHLTQSQYQNDSQINIKISNVRYGEIQLLCSDLFCLQFWSHPTTSYFNKCVTTSV